MGAMSKFAERGGMGLGLARAAYGGAILTYIGGVAVPRWLNYQRAEQRRRVGRSKADETPSSPDKKSPAGGKLKGPTVNKQFFAQLSQLLKVINILLLGGVEGINILFTYTQISHKLRMYR